MLVRAGENQGWRNYFRLTAQLANSGQTIQLLAADEYNEIAEEFIQQLYSITSDRIHTNDIAERYAALIPFLEGGITRLAGTRPPTP